jgi:hypothetical protein
MQGAAKRGRAQSGSPYSIGIQEQLAIGTCVTSLNYTLASRLYHIAKPFIISLFLYLYKLEDMTRVGVCVLIMWALVATYHSKLNLHAPDPPCVHQNNISQPIYC